MKLAIFIVD